MSGPAEPVTVANPSLNPPGVAALLIGVAFLTFLVVNSSQRTWSDFVAQYAGAKLVGTSALYDYDAVTKVELQLDQNGKTPKPFWRPPFYAVALWPLGKLPYPQALIVWEALNLVAFGGFLLLWPRTGAGFGGRLTALGICAWFVPVWSNIYLGQDMFVILLLVASAYACWQRGLDFTAGMLLSLCAFKPNLFLLLPVLIIARRLWRTACGVLAGGALLFAISCLAAGSWSWASAYFELLRRASDLVGPAGRQLNLVGLISNVPWLDWLRWPVVAAVVVAVWVACRRVPPDLALALMLAGGLVISPRGLVYDGMILLPLMIRIGEVTRIPVWALVGAGFGIGCVAVAGWEVAGQLSVVAVFFGAWWVAINTRSTHRSP